MSAGKKKIPQAELRRLMSQHKTKLPPKKVLSAVAKYTEGGQLTCKICSMVVSESLWDLHKKSLQHLENSQRLRTADPVPTPNNNHSFKQPNPVPAMKPLQIRGILKNAPPRPVSTTVSALASNEMSTISSSMKRPSDDDDGASPVKRKARLPEGFFDDAKEGTAENVDEPMEEGEDVVVVSDATNIPEGFFDDPMLDAKARNIEYKNPVEEEWEKFQKEIKEETTVSAQIIAEDQDEATVERQIDEIDEQMRNWSRVLDMERKKERIQQEGPVKQEGSDDDASSADEDEFVEFVDWRLKKAYK